MSKESLSPFRSDEDLLRLLQHLLGTSLAAIDACLLLHCGTVAFVDGVCILEEPNAIDVLPSRTLRNEVLHVRTVIHDVGEMLLDAHLIPLLHIDVDDLALL